MDQETQCTFLESDEINDLLKGDDMIRFFGLLVAGMLSFTPQTSAQEVAAAEAIQPLVVKFYDITPLVTPHLHHTLDARLLFHRSVSERQRSLRQVN